MTCEHSKGFMCRECYLGAIPKPQPDPVSSPAHYTSGPSGIQAIQITRWRNFNIGNALKYLWRNGLKDSEAQIQDLRKAIWYIEDEISRLESLKNG